MNELSKVKVKCVKCGVEIPFENGAFQECPLGHPAPTEQQIREAVYLQLSGQQNAEIKREFADLRDKPDDLVYVHPLAEHLPRYAVLYVEDNQIAVYDHCGAREFLRGPGRVIITGDDRSDSENQNEAIAEKAAETPAPETKKRRSKTEGMESIFSLDDSEDKALAELDAAGVEYVDKRDAGGALWVVGGEELGGLLRGFSQYGVGFRYKEPGGKATGGKPGWWSK